MTTNLLTDPSNKDKSSKGGNSQIINNELAKAALKLVAKHGLDPCTKPQAAAHEAGHIIVAHALGWKVTHAKLIKRHDFDKILWEGFTYHEMPGYDKPKVGQVTDDPTGAFQIAVNNLAGFLGEQMVALHHPTSSLDERYLAKAIARELNGVWGKPEGYMQSIIGKICLSTIKYNSDQFDVIREHLTRTERLNRHDAKRMLSRVSRLDLDTLLKEIAQ